MLARIKKTTLFGSLCVCTYAVTIAAYLALPGDLAGKDKDDAVDYRKIFNSQIENNDRNVNITKATTYLVVVTEPEWCGPCQRLEPVIASLEEEGYKIASISRKEYEKPPWNAHLYPKVKNLPTLVFIQDHKVIEVLEGFQSKSAIKAVLNGK